jgi:hypothetical protein
MRCCRSVYFESTRRFSWSEICVGWLLFSYPLRFIQNTCRNFDDVIVIVIVKHSNAFICEYIPERNIGNLYIEKAAFLNKHDVIHRQYRMDRRRREFEENCCLIKKLRYPYQSDSRIRILSSERRVKGNIRGGGGGRRGGGGCCSPLLVVFRHGNGNLVLEAFTDFSGLLFWSSIVLDSFLFRIYKYRSHLRGSESV